MTFTDLDKDLPFSQPVTFAHLEWQRCLASTHTNVHRHLCPLMQNDSTDRLTSSPSTSLFLVFLTTLALPIALEHDLARVASAPVPRARKRAEATTQSGV